MKGRNSTYRPPWFEEFTLLDRPSRPTVSLWNVAGSGMFKAEGRAERYEELTRS